MKTENAERKRLLHQGIVESVEKINSKYGLSYRIKMDHGINYYFNCKSESTAEKFFKPGEKAIFTVKEKTSGEKIYQVIENVMYAF